MKNNILNIILCFLASAIIIVLLVQPAGGEEKAKNTFSESYIYSETSVQLTNYYSVSNTNDIEQLRELVQEYEKLLASTDAILKGANELGYDENHPIVVIAQEEQNNLNFVLKEYQMRLSNLIWQERFKEYPTASIIWLHLQSKGYSDVVCAGIMGNIMAEVGGHTLNLEPFTNIHKNYYGICQWSLKYYPDVAGAALDEQLIYLDDTIVDRFNVYGYKYKKGFTYEDFCNLTDETDAAVAFADCYEVCGSGSYEKRKNNAVIAYEYFVD